MLSDEQVAMVADELGLPRIAVRYAAEQREFLGVPFTPADLIGDLAARIAASRRTQG